MADAEGSRVLQRTEQQQHDTHEKGKKTPCTECCKYRVVLQHCNSLLLLVFDNLSPQIPPVSQLTMLDEKCRQARHTADNHGETQYPSSSKIAQTRPKKDICWQLTSAGQEEIEDFVAT